MNDKNVSFSVPPHADVLRSVAAMLCAMAEDIEDGIDLRVSSDIEHNISATANPVIPLATTPDAPAIPATMPPGVEVDANGIPWDGRIHANSKKMNVGDGCWKKRKGIDVATHTAVTAELKAAMDATTPVTPLQPVTPLAMDFNMLMGEISTRINQGLTTTPRVNEIVQAHGIANTAMVAVRPDMMPTILAAIDADIAACQPAQ